MYKSHLVLTLCPASLVLLCPIFRSRFLSHLPVSTSFFRLHVPSPCSISLSQPPVVEWKLDESGGSGACSKDFLSPDRLKMIMRYMDSNRIRRESVIGWGNRIGLRRNEDGFELIRNSRFECSAFLDRINANELPPITLNGITLPSVNEVRNLEVIMLFTRKENSRKNYRPCPHNKGAKNISTEICRLRKKKLQCFPFLYAKFRNFWERARENFLNSTVNFQWPKIFISAFNSILCYKGVQYYFTHERRARRSPECVKKYVRVAYVILCNSVYKVRHNECTHGDEKPPPPIRVGRVYRGKERMYGGKERVQGCSPWWGSRGRSPPPTGWKIPFYFGEDLLNFFIIITILVCNT